MGNHAAGSVEAVHLSPSHTFTKAVKERVRLVAGLGVDGDVHLGATVQHRSRVVIDPAQPNLRQVHLIHGELHDELRAAGFRVGAGDMGENITTRGIDLLSLPTGTVLRIGESALVAITGLRNPCKQLDDFESGLLGAVLDRDDDGRVVRKAGVMGVVLLGGVVETGDRIEHQAPPGPPRPLERV
jgi:MOSC domain-containing protein YiiM